MEIPLLAAEAVVPVDMVSRWVQVRGHTVAGPYLHGSAYDLTLQAHRRAVLADLRRERPYFLVLFSATTSWDRLAKMTKTGDELRQERSFQLGPPGARTNSRGETRLSSFSSAWRAPALKRLQRSFGLRSVDVAGHRLLTSSQAVISKFLDPAVVKSCDSTKSGLSKSLVDAFERQFDFETELQARNRRVHQCYQTTAVPGAIDFYHDVLATGDTTPEDEDFNVEGGQESEDEVAEPFKGEITPAIRAAVKRVHEATGHRPPKRLARALLLSGAPPAAVQAARELKCDVCAERRPSQPSSGEPAGPSSSGRAGAR